MCELLIPRLNRKSAVYRHIIVGTRSADDHTHHHISLKAPRAVPGEEVSARLDFSIQPLCGQNILLSIGALEHTNQRAASEAVFRTATVMGCVLFRPAHRFSNIWKLLSIQSLITAQKGICIMYGVTEGERVQADLPSVWPKASLVDYVTQQWQWPFTSGACSSSLKAYKHASLPLSFASLPALTWSPGKCRSTACLYIYKGTPQFPVKVE